MLLAELVNGSQDAGELYAARDITNGKYHATPTVARNRNAEAAAGKTDGGGDAGQGLVARCDTLTWFGPSSNLRP